MEIKDLKPNQGNVDLLLKVKDKGDVRSFEKFGKKGRVCTAIVTDATGEIKLTLWNDDIDKIKSGDKIHLINGWCSEYQGEKQLSTGKFGQIEVVESSSEAAKETEPEMESDSENTDDEDNPDWEEETIE